MPVTRACDLMGVPRSTYYRLSRGYTHYRPVTGPVAHTDRRQPAALSTIERDQVVTVLLDGKYANLSVLQTYWQAFDSGEVECSQRTFYRIATTARLVGDRRRRRGGAVVSRRRPVVAAHASGDLWSWDVTALRGPCRNDWYKLSLVIDVFSRYPVAWRIDYHEDAANAVEMFTDAFERHGAPQVLHSDNGAVMRSEALLSAVDEAGTSASFSRPRVSDDNPFSESLFKTIKYDLECPDRFDDIDHAREWTVGFLDRYAREHRHSGLGFYTPASVFDGTAVDHRRRRQERLDEIWARHPERFRCRPVAPRVPAVAGINIEYLSQTG